MALLIKDGMDYGFTNNLDGRLDAKWNFSLNSGGGNLVMARSTLGRFGGGSLENNSYAGTSSFSQAIVAHKLAVPLPSTNVIFLGYSWLCTSLSAGGGAGAGQEIMGVSQQPMSTNGWFNNSHIFVRVKNDATGHFWEVYRGNTATPGSPVLLGTFNASTTLGLTGGTWFWLEWEINVHATTGYVKLRVDGVEKISITAANTANAGQAATVEWVGPCAVQNAGYFGGAQSFDDIHIWDNRGTGMIAASTGKGKFIATLRPTSNGFTNPGTPSSGTAFSCVDEAFGNSTSDLVDFITSLAGQTELFNVADGPGYSGIEDVTVTLIQNGTGAGLGSVKPAVRLGSTNYLGDTLPIYAEARFRASEHHFALNPATAAAWAAADIPAMQVGYQVQT